MTSWLTSAINSWVYLVISCFFQLTGALIPLQSNHHLNAGIAWTSKGSSNAAPGISDGSRVIVAFVPPIAELVDAISRERWMVGDSFNVWLAWGWFWFCFLRLNSIYTAWRGRAALFFAAMRLFSIVSYSESTPGLYSGSDVTRLPRILSPMRKRPIDWTLNAVQKINTMYLHQVINIAFLITWLLYVCDLTIT